jgi:hypothetical protein
LDGLANDDDDNATTRTTSVRHISCPKTEKSFIKRNRKTSKQIKVARAVKVFRRMHARKYDGFSQEFSMHFQIAGFL